MPADGKPSEEISFLAHPLRAMTKLVVRAPRATVVAGLALAVASIFIGATQLSMNTSRLDLLNPKSSYNQLWLDYIEDFGKDDDTVVVVQGADAEAIRPVVDHLAQQIERHDWLFRDVLHRVDLTPLGAKRLHYLTPVQLQQVEQFLFQVQPVVAGDWSFLQLGRLVENLGRASMHPDPAMRQQALHTYSQHVDNLYHTLFGSEDYSSPWPSLSQEEGESDPFQTQYLLTGDGCIGLILLRLIDDGQSFDRGTKAIAQLRELLARVNEQYPDVEIGLTGLPVMENDEMRASEESTIESSVLSLIGVALLFIVGFGGLRHPLLAVAALITGICWTLGYIVFSVGHLNILSMSFGIILIGLGIDFGIHYVAGYLHERQAGVSSAEALLATADKIGPGVVTGGVTTAIAFFAAGLTDFTGVAELGIIAGGGIVLCLLGAIFMLPALIQWSDVKRDAVNPPQPVAIHRWFSFTQRFPRSTMLLAGAVIAVSSLGLDNLWYDHNLLNLQPEDLESVQLEQKLLDETDQSVWFAISLADSRDELLARKERFQALSSVERTEEIASLIPGGEAEKSPIIARINQQLAQLPQQPPQIQVAAPSEVAARMMAAQSQLGVAAESPLGVKAAQVIEALRTRQLPDCYRALAAYQQQVAFDLLMRLQALAASSDPQGPRLEDLPPSLVERFVGSSGRYLLKVYSKNDIWDMDDLSTFVQEVRSIDPQATGQPLQTYEASRQMQRSYLHAALYALIGVMMILVIDFRSLGYTLLALIPVGLGLLMTFGIMGLLGVPLNPANMIVLPLVMGIGIDDGVHVLHDFRHQKGPYRLSSATAAAIVMTTLTTMLGFGTMMLADHRGLESLGRVLTIGIFSCMFMALIPLTALLAWISRHRTVEEPDSSDESVDFSPETAELDEVASAAP